MGVISCFYKTAYFILSPSSWSKKCCPFLLSVDSYRRFLPFAHESIAIKRVVFGSDRNWLQYTELYEQTYFISGIWLFCSLTFYYMLFISAMLITHE